MCFFVFLSYFLYYLVLVVVIFNNLFKISFKKCVPRRLQRLAKSFLHVGRLFYFLDTGPKVFETIDFNYFSLLLLVFISKKIIYIYIYIYIIFKHNLPDFPEIFYFSKKDEKGKWTKTHKQIKKWRALCARQFFPLFVVALSFFCGKLKKHIIYKLYINYLERKL